MNTAEQRKRVIRDLIHNLSEERKRQGLSMNALASMAGLSQSMITRLENNPTNPTLDSLLRIAGGLDVNLGTELAGAIHKNTPVPPPTGGRSLKSVRQ